MKIFTLCVWITFSVLACSADNSESNKSHVWEDQTNTLDKARAVEDSLLDSADKQRKQIQDQVQ